MGHEIKEPRISCTLNMVVFVVSQKNFRV